MRIEFARVIKMIGFLIIATGIFMLAPLLMSVFSCQHDLSAFVISVIIAFVSGGLCMLNKSDLSNLNKKEGYLVVTFGWIFVCILGSFPYVFMDKGIGFSQAVFESVSGFTTTGASIFDDIEGLSYPILIWRSLTQWIGGMGIIVFTLAISPLLGIGGVELFVAESPGPTTNKIHPRIKEVAKRLWYLYVGLTIFLTGILYYISNMSFFDAINHAMTTMSTGGFSTKNSSIAYYESAWVEYPIIIFMAIGGVNYTILYYLFKGKIKKSLSSEEFRYYLWLLVVATIIVGVVLVSLSHYGYEEAFRTAAFQVVSVVTTTGFVTADYSIWHPSITAIFLLLTFAGASAGSTSGGIKIIRHLVFIKNSYLELKRLLHPNAYLRVKVDGEIVTGKIITHILVFLLMYLMILGASTFVLTISESSQDFSFISYIGLSITCLSNVGPAVGSIGPLQNFASLSDFTQLFLSLIMIIGRLEVFTVIIILAPVFWKKH